MLAGQVVGHESHLPKGYVSRSPGNTKVRQNGRVDSVLPAVQSYQHRCARGGIEPTVS